MKTIKDKKTKSGLKNRPEPLNTTIQMQLKFPASDSNCVITSGNVLTLPQGSVAKLIILAGEAWQPRYAVSDFAIQIACSGVAILAKMSLKLFHFQR
jgi:hypothetical protein